MFHLHIHVHVNPRRVDDDRLFNREPRPGDLDAIGRLAERIRANLRYTMWMDLPPRCGSGSRFPTPNMGCA